MPPQPCPLTAERALKLAGIGFVFDASGYRRNKKPTGDPGVQNADDSVAMIQYETL